MMSDIQLVWPYIDQICGKQLVKVSFRDSVAALLRRCNRESISSVGRRICSQSKSLHDDCNACFLPCVVGIRGKSLVEGDQNQACSMKQVPFPNQ